MKLPALLPFLLAATLLLTGCQTRSISDSGYDRDRYGNSSAYRGELTEFEVLGVEPDRPISDETIAQELKNSHPVTLQPTSNILLIQSGADFPDAAMMDLLAQRFHTTAFSGQPGADRRPSWRDRPVTDPAAEKRPANSYSQSLRLAAARGGYDKIICYWGVLESEHVNQATKFVSWVPLVGYAIPDKRENMRLRLKAALIDVATGQWTLINPPPVASTSLSSIYSRRDTDQSLVAALKDQGYKQLAAILLATVSR